VDASLGILDIPGIIPATITIRDIPGIIRDADIIRGMVIIIRNITMPGENNRDNRLFLIQTTN